jgi:nicotinate phosphoribosyltransferase
LNEYKIDALLAGGAPIDAFGVGTERVTSSDAPALGGVYKLVERETPEGHRIGGAKGSAEKATYPFGKQVFRTSVEGQYRADTIGAAEERLAGRPLRVPAMRRGRALGKPPSLEEIRRRAQEELARLPAGVLRLRDPERCPGRFSEALERAREEAIRRGTRGREEGKKPEALSLRKDAEE